MKKVELAKPPDALTAPRAIFMDAKRRAVRNNKADNLDLLWSVLIEIREAGGRDYSLAEVGRRLEEKGGLKTQSLRNAGGADFREVITAFAQSVMGSPRYIAKTKSNVDQALDFISDPSVRTVLKEEIARAKKLREENAMLRNALSRLSIPTSEERLSTLAPEDQSTQKPPSLTLTDNHLALGIARDIEKRVVATAQSTSVISEALLKALTKGTDPERIRKCGFTPMEDGSITNVRGDHLFPVGFLTACEAVLAIYAKEGP